jgi:hypothetical protein
MIADITHSASKGSTDRWENEGGPMAPRRASASDELQIELKRYGVVPVQLTVFDWGGYRYSNERDAIAAAKRAAMSA